jgi:hypothetical protein
MNEQIEIENAFSEADSIDMPDLDTEEKISERLLCDELSKNEVSEACVEGLDIGESNYSRSYDVYKIYFVYNGFKWAAEFDPDDRHDLEKLKQLFNRHNVDLGAPSNIIGKRITVINKGKKPSIITKGPSTSVIKEQSNRKTVKLNRYKGLKPTLSSFLFENISLSIIVLFFATFLSSFLAAFVLSAILIINVFSFVFQSTIRPDIPNIENHLTIKQVR